MDDDPAATHSNYRCLLFRLLSSVLRHVGLTALGLTALGLTALGLTALGLTALGLTALGLTALGLHPLLGKFEFSGDARDRP
ncbi:hypothetical protein K7864_35830 [Streptomyces sp. SP2-10]|nr:hypothetical protein [Streptomyces sp. SP2-10]